jgi:hypothetical protein
MRALMLFAVAAETVGLAGAWYLFTDRSPVTSITWAALYLFAVVSPLHWHGRFDRFVRAHGLEPAPQVVRLGWTPLATSLAALLMTLKIVADLTGR